jgi:uncharacterized repeat protein (TIGR03803 family)
MNVSRCKRNQVSGLVRVLAVAVALFSVAAQPALARKLTTLYRFSGGVDGALPEAVLLDAKGNLYGTTFFGGAYGNGTVFKLTPSGKETVLYSFSGGLDGHYPLSGLVLDHKGNIYGVTQRGGTYDHGLVYKVSPSGTETVLYSFTGGTDGGGPGAGLTFDGNGNLYGTTSAGGANNYGTIFELIPSGAETVLHSFNWTDGAYPYAALVFDAGGNLYGTTFYGGAAGVGTDLRQVLFSTKRATSTAQRSTAALTATAQSSS